MVRRIVLFLTALVFLTSSYVLYQRQVVPLLQPKLPELSPDERPRGPRRSDTEIRILIDRPPVAIKIAAEAFGPDAPEVHAAFLWQFSDEQATAYFYTDDYQELPDGSLQLRPFSAVIHQRPAGISPSVSEDSPTGNETLTMLRCPSARLQFSEPLDLTHLKAGKPIGGELEGQIEIRHRPVSGEDFVLWTRDVQFAESQQRLWTPAPVRFQQGESHGEGQGLEVLLIPAEPGEISRDKPAVTGVAAIQVLRDVQMFLQVDRHTGGLEDIASLPVDDTSSGAKKTDPLPVDIQCQGPFRYDLQTHTASFSNDVLAIQHTPKGEPNQLQCDTLELVFAPSEQVGGHHASHDKGAVHVRTEPNIPSKGERANAPGVGLAFQQLRASGEPLLLESPANESHILAAELVYDVLTRATTLHNDPEVIVSQRENEFHAPHITLRQNDDGQMSELEANGPGWLELPRPAAQGGTLEARWHKQFRLTRQENSQVLHMAGNAFLQQPQEGTLRGEELSVWLKASNPPPSPDLAIRESKQAAVDPESQQPTRDLRPERLQARGNVIMASARLVGRTEELTMRFENLPTAETQSEARGALTSPDVALLARSAAPSFQRQSPVDNEQDRDPASDPSEATSPEASLSPRLPAPSPQRGSEDEETSLAPSDSPEQMSGPVLTLGDPESHAEGPLHIDAQQLDVELVRRGSSAEVRRVWAEGQVYVRQPQPEDADSESAAGRANSNDLEVEADALELIAQDSQSNTLWLKGRPARLQNADMQLEGHVVTINSADNRLNVEGAGLLSWTAAPDSPQAQDPATRQLDIHWARSLAFDGIHGVFTGEVVAQLDTAELQGHVLEVTLSEPVSFTDLGQAPDEPTRVRHLVCKPDPHQPDADVRFLQHREQNGSVVEQQQMTAHEIRVDQETGDVEAIGPGQMRSVRHGAPALGLVGRIEPAQAGKPDSLRLVHITYDGTMTGNLHQRYAVFHDGAVVTSAPVQDIDEQVNPLALPEEGLWLRCRKLEIWRRAAPAQGRRRDRPAAGFGAQFGDRDSGPVEIIATGNAELELEKNGRLTARADRISYDEAKDLLVLEGRGRNSARLWHQRQPGQPRTQMQARKIYYEPGTQHVRFNDGQVIDVLR